MSRPTDRPGHANPRARRARRPAIEPLEGRALLTTYMVTSAADTGTNTLRGVINKLNLSGTASNTIDFAIAGSGVKTITLASALPAITRQVTVDATTQAAEEGLSYATPLVVIDGSAVAAGSSGLTLGAGSGSSTIQGLSIVGFKESAAAGGGNGIDLEDSGSDLIQSDYLGIKADGVTGEGNSVGIRVNSPGNTIGGTSGPARDVISGNGQYGVSIAATAGVGNLVIGDYVGTNAAGSAAVANFQGIEVDGSGTTIGGTAAGSGDVISGNQFQGIDTPSPTSVSSLLVEGNIIGLNAAGLAPVGNGEGLRFQATSSTVGGITAAARNIISGNSGAGIHLLGDSDKVQGNYFGLNVAGAAVAGGGDGCGLEVDATNSTIGGLVAGAGNTIGGSTGFTLSTSNGVEFVGGLDVLSSGVAVYANTIGLTAAGAADPDMGAGVVVGTDDSSASATAPVALDDSIGGPVAGAGNTITNSVGPGVEGAELTAGTYTGLAIRGNAIYGNKGLGIDIPATGMTVASTLFISNLTYSSGLVNVQGYEFGLPGTTVSLDFFGYGADTSGYGQGAFYLGSTGTAIGSTSPTITLGPTGFAFFSSTFATKLPGVPEVTATATDSAGNTSGFSANYPATAAGPSADLVLTATAKSGAASVGGDVTIIETVVNKGPSTASDVLLYDSLPAGMTVPGVVGAVSPYLATSLGSIADYTSLGVVVASLGSLGPGQGVTIEIVATPSMAGTLADYVGVSSDTFDPNYTNNLAGFDITVAPTTSASTADLAIAQYPSAASVPSNDPVIYTIDAANLSKTTAATDVTIDDVLPAGATVDGIVPGQGGGVTLVGNLLSVNLGTIAPGGIATLAVAVTPNAANLGAISNVANVAGDQYDPGPAPDSSVATTAVTAAVPNIHFFMAESAYPALGEVGQFQSFTLTVENFGPDPATNVTLNQALPAFTTFVAATPSNGTKATVGGGDLSEDFGTLAAGAVVSLVLVVVPTIPGPLTNLAGVYSPDVPTATAAIATASVPIIAGPAVANIQGFAANRGLIVSFDEALNPSTVTPANFQLISTGPKGSGPNVTIPVTVSYNPSNDSVTVLPAQALNPGLYYELFVSGSSTGVADLAGHRLANSAFGSAGTSYSVSFLAGTLPQA